MKVLKNDTQQLNPVSIILSFVWEAFALMDLCVCCASVSRRHIRPSEVDWGSGNTVEVRQMRIMGGKSESKWEVADDNRKFHASCWTLYFVISLSLLSSSPSFLSLQGQPKVSRKHLSILNIDNVVIRLLMASILPIACSAFCQINKCVKLHFLSHCHFNTSHFLNQDTAPDSRKTSQHWRWWWCQ